MTVRTGPTTPPRGVLGWVVHDRLSQMVFVLVSGAVTFAYSLLLRYSFTQRLSFHNWHYLDARLFGFSVAFGIGVGGLVTSLPTTLVARSCLAFFLQQRRQPFDVPASPGGKESKTRHRERRRVVENQLHPGWMTVNDGDALVHQAQPRPHNDGDSDG